MVGDLSLKQAVREYRDIYLAYRNFARRTRVEYVNDLEDLIAFLEEMGVKMIGEVTLPHLIRYMAELEKRSFAGSTRKRKVISIRSFLSFMYLDGYITSNIGKQLIPPYTDHKMPHYLTEKECNRLKVACAGNVRDAAIIELLLQTGIKLSELTRLSLDDIELIDDGMIIRIRSIWGRTERMLPLNFRASQALKAYLRIRSKTQSSIIFLNRLGDFLGERGIQKMIKKYFKIAGIEKASANTLRHTFTMRHIVKGTSLKAIQEMMGHNDPKSTFVYVSLVRGYGRNEM